MRLKLDVEQWENEEQIIGIFHFFSYQENLCNSLESTGTTITVSRLRKEISADLKSRDFEKELMVSWQKTDCSRIRQKHTGSMKYREVLSCQG